MTTTDQSGLPLATGSPAPTASSGASASPLASPSPVAASASVAVELHDASRAARAVLDADSFDVAVTARREKDPADPTQTLMRGDGRVEPAIGRGRMRFDFSAIFADPGQSEQPNPASILDVTWTPDDVFARSATPPIGNWLTTSRAVARTSGGYVGRLPDEVLGLVTLVASSRPDEFVALEDASIDGATARRWRVTVPVEDAVVEGVPADTPDVTVLKKTYGIDTLDLDIWLVDGALRRIGYEIAREEAPYGGPDRTIVTYDWSEAKSTDPIVVPPEN